MSVIDPRMAKRRFVVAEAGARRRLRSMIVAVSLLALIGLGWWVTQSELLDIDSISVSGAVEANVSIALGDAGIAHGSTLVSAILSADDAEQALEADPWVAAASVNVLFPGRIEVDVIERTAAAVVSDPNGRWVLMSADLTVLEPAPVLPPALGRIDHFEIAAAGTEFLSILKDPAGAVLTLENGEVWVRQSGVTALLGRPTDMIAKAAAFVALLSEEVPAGWGINLIAPSRPALFEMSQP